jgi:hypothetical protein
MDDIEIEFDSDYDDAEVAAVPALARDWRSALAFALAAVFLVAAPFGNLYSTRSAVHLAVDGWGRVSVDASSDLTISGQGLGYGVDAWALALVCLLTAAILIRRNGRRAGPGRLVAAAVRFGFGLGGAVILTNDLLPDLLDPNVRVGPFFYLLGAATAASGVGVVLVWRGYLAANRDTDVEPPRNESIVDSWTKGH